MSLLSECFSGMKVVKWFCYENKFLERGCLKLKITHCRLTPSRHIGISVVRNKELKGVWNIEVNGSTKYANFDTVQ